VIAISTSKIAVIDRIYFTTVWRDNFTINNIEATPIIRAFGYQRLQKGPAS
jgi:hypothetical protein